VGNGRVGHAGDRGTAGCADRLGQREEKRKAADTAGEYENGGLYGITLYFGKRKSGKSSRMGSALGQVDRLLLFDGRGASPLSENFFEKFGFERTFRQPGELRAFLRSHLTEPFRVLYQPSIDPPTSLEDHAPGLSSHFAAVTQLVIACGRMIYAIDEVDRFTSAGFTPSGLDYLINQGRHVQVSLVATSRRPAQVPRELTSQAHLFFIFRNTEPRDLSYLEQYIGSEAADRLPNLAPYQFLRWEESEGISIGGGIEKKLLK
jgi:hypothetical protein